jgi:hypothetical protein
MWLWLAATEREKGDSLERKEKKKKRLSFVENLRT